MISSIVNRIIVYQIKLGLIKDEDKGIFRYGYDLLVSRIISFILIGLISTIFKIYIEIFIFLLAFIPLRQYAGGYHLTTPEKCIGLSAFLVWLVGMIMKSGVSKATLSILLVLTLFADVVIFILAPVDCENKRLDEKEQIVYKQYTKIVLIVELIIYTAIYVGNIEKIASGIFLAHVLEAGSLVVGWKLPNIKNRKPNNL